MNLKLETCSKLFWVRTEKETERYYCRKLGQAFDIRNTFFLARGSQAMPHISYFTDPDLSQCKALICLYGYFCFWFWFLLFYSLNIPNTAPTPSPPPLFPTSHQPTLFCSSERLRPSTGSQQSLTHSSIFTPPLPTSRLYKASHHTEWA